MSTTQASPGVDWTYRPSQTTTTSTDVTKVASYTPVRKRVELYPELLAERVQKYAVVMPPFAPVYDRVLVYPLGEADQADKVGSLYMPTTTKDKHGAQRGLLVKAGARAIEELYSHGIELGHIVVTARLAPWQRQYATPAGVAHVLVLRAPDVVASEDLDQAYAEGRLWLERDGSTGRVELHDRFRVDPADNDEGI